MIRLPTDILETIRAGGTVVVPSRQRAHAARLAYSAAALRSGQRVWASPDILAVEAWLIREVERQAASATSEGRVAPPRLLSPAEEWFLWRQCATEATGELDLVNRGALAEALRRSSALAAEFGIDVSRLHDVAGTEPALLHEVQRAVDKRCRSLDSWPLATLLQSVTCIGDQRPVALRGFLSVSPRLARIVASRRDKGYQSSVGSSAERTGSLRPSVVIAADELDELERIALWCKRHTERAPDARILVMLAGPPGARERLATLIRQTFDPRAWLGMGGPGSHSRESTDSLAVIEGGSPLAQLPAISHALFTLAWLAGEAAEFEDLGEWLRAPYWTAPDAISRARLELWLRESGRMSVGARELTAAVQASASSLKGDLLQRARELGTRVSTATIRLGQGAASPRVGSERFGEALNAMGWPGERARSSPEQQTVLRFHELLDEFGQLALAARSLSRDTAIRWFTELAVRTAFRPADDDAIVTISPVLADPIARYDAIWVAGLHADVFPQPVQPDPYLPLSAQITAGVPLASAAGRLAEAQALMESWRASADELVLSSPARSEDLELLPSPLLAPWLDSAASNIAARLPPIWLPERLHREGLLEAVEDTMGLLWPPEQPLPAGTRSLDLQNQCPFKAYAELRLGGTELGAPEPGIAPDQRGLLLHAALQRLWGNICNSNTLAALPDTKLQRLIHDCVEEAAHALLARVENQKQRGATAVSSPQGDLFAAPSFPPALMRECRRAVRLIRALCDLERKRAPFRVQDRELDTTLTLAGSTLRMRIDRLDVFEEGGRAILDYKSGKRAAADWYGERPSHPQLLAYMAAIGESVAAMATVNVTAREVRFDGIARSQSLLPKVKGIQVQGGEDPQQAWQTWRQQWLQRLERLARDFLDGRAAVDPKPGACDFCHVSAVCRIADRGAPQSGEGSTSFGHDDA